MVFKVSVFSKRRKYRWSQKTTDSASLPLKFLETNSRLQDLIRFGDSLVDGLDFQNTPSMCVCVCVCVCVHRRVRILLLSVLHVYAGV